MKKTIITIASITALAVSANAQLTLGGTAYNAGDYINFSTGADLIAGTNAVYAGGGSPGSSWYRDSNGASPNTDYHALNTSTGQLFQGGGLGVVGTATWAAGNTATYSFNQVSGVHQVALSVAVLGFAAGDYLNFSSQADLLSGTNATYSGGAGGGDWLRDSNLGTGYSAMNRATGGTFGAATTGTATWAAGKIDTYSYNQLTGVHQVRVAVVETIPEPSSAALLGLGALGLITRRKR